MKNIFYKYYFVGICILMLGYTAKVNWHDGQWQRVLQADARGYYAYLPAKIIYNNLRFDDDMFQEMDVKNAYDKNLIYDYRQAVHGKVVDKYFAGEAVLLSPFFIMAHGFAIVAGLPTDGYSQIYMIFLTIAALFYAMIGLFFIRKTLGIFNIDEMAIAITLISVIFGTNLFYYTIGEPGMSHVYSFAVISAFIYFVTNYFATSEVKSALYAAILFGLVLMIRPVNGLIIFAVPWLALTPSVFVTQMKKLFSEWDTILILISLAITPLIIQSLIYHSQTGEFWVYSYGKETFDFTKFNAIDFLFSYKKGLFLYTPICLFSLGGIIALRKNRFFSFGMLGFLVLVIYVLSSWWNWYYGGSFSSRVMVEYLPFFALLLAFFIQKATQWKYKTIMATFLFCFILMNQVQTLQYRYFIIHWSDMDKAHYWDTFMDITPIIHRK